MEWIKKYLHILACPYCRGNLILKDNKLICKKCKKEFKIVDGIPILLRW
ncbi:Trm112 family protein [Methanocaldococcus indicus]